MLRPIYKTRLRSESSIIGALKANEPPFWPLDCPGCSARMEFRSTGTGTMQRVCPECDRTITEADLLREHREKKPATIPAPSVLEASGERSEPVVALAAAAAVNPGPAPAEVSLPTEADVWAPTRASIALLAS